MNFTKQKLDASYISFHYDEEIPYQYAWLYHNTLFSYE